MSNNVVIREPYELSIWIDELIPEHEENGKVILEHYEERKEAIIGADDLNTPFAAHNPNLILNVNGSVTLTFEMFYRCFDEWYGVEGDFNDNPYTSLLNNETKIKFKFRDEWYDLIIKKVEENSDNYTFKYTTSSFFIDELSKNGFKVELNTELENNQGIVTDLALKIMEETDWVVDTEESDLLVQTITEPIYVGFLSKTIKVEKVCDYMPDPLQKDDIPDITEIPKGERVYFFYSDLQDEAPQPLILYRKMTRVKVTDNNEDEIEKIKNSVSYCYTIDIGNEKYFYYEDYMVDLNQDIITNSFNYRIIGIKDDVDDTNEDVKEEKNFVMTYHGEEGKTKIPDVIQDNFVGIPLKEEILNRVHDYQQNKIATIIENYKIFKNSEDSENTELNNLINRLAYASFKAILKVDINSNEVEEAKEQYSLTDKEFETLQGYLTNINNRIEDISFENFVNLQPEEINGNEISGILRFHAIYNRLIFERVTAFANALNANELDESLYEKLRRINDNSSDIFLKNYLISSYKNYYINDFEANSKDEQLSEYKENEYYKFIESLPFYSEIFTIDDNTTFLGLFSDMLENNNSGDDFFEEISSHIANKVSDEQISQNFIVYQNFGDEWYPIITNNNFVFSLSNNYRGKKVIRSPRSSYDVNLEWPVTVYTRSDEYINSLTNQDDIDKEFEPNNNGYYIRNVDGKFELDKEGANEGQHYSKKEYYGYIHTEDYSPNLAQNFLANSYDYSSIDSGWVFDGTPTSKDDIKNGHVGEEEDGAFTGQIYYLNPMNFHLDASNSMLVASVLEMKLKGNNDTRFYKDSTGKYFKSVLKYVSIDDPSNSLNVDNSVTWQNIWKTSENFYNSEDSSNLLRGKIYSYTQEQFLKMDSAAVDNLRESYLNNLKATREDEKSALYDTYKDKTDEELEQICDRILSDQRYSKTKKVAINTGFSSNREIIQSLNKGEQYVFAISLGRYREGEEPKTYGIDEIYYGESAPDVRYKFVPEEFGNINSFDSAVKETLNDKERNPIKYVGEGYHKGESEYQKIYNAAYKDAQSQYDAVFYSGGSDKILDGRFKRSGEWVGFNKIKGAWDNGSIAYRTAYRYALTQLMTSYSTWKYIASKVKLDYLASDGTIFSAPADYSSSNPMDTIIGNMFNVENALVGILGDEGLYWEVDLDTDNIELDADEKAELGSMTNILSELSDFKNLISGTQNVYKVFINRGLLYRNKTLGQFNRGAPGCFIPGHTTMYVPDDFNVCTDKDVANLNNPAAWTDYRYNNYTDEQNTRVASAIAGVLASFRTNTFRDLFNGFTPKEEFEKAIKKAIKKAINGLWNDLASPSREKNARYERSLSYPVKFQLNHGGYEYQKWAKWWDLYATKVASDESIKNHSEEFYGYTSTAIPLDRNSNLDCKKLIKLDNCFYLKEDIADELSKLVNEYLEIKNKILLITDQNSNEYNNYIAWDGFNNIWINKPILLDNDDNAENIKNAYLNKRNSLIAEELNKLEEKKKELQNRTSLDLEKTIIALRYSESQSGSSNAVTPIEDTITFDLNKCKFKEDYALNPFYIYLLAKEDTILNLDSSLIGFLKNKYNISNNIETYNDVSNINNSELGIARAVFGNYISKNKDSYNTLITAMSFSGAILDRQFVSDYLFLYSIYLRFSNQLINNQTLLDLREKFDQELRFPYKFGQQIFSPSKEIPCPDQLLLKIWDLYSSTKNEALATYTYVHQGGTFDIKNNASIDRDIEEKLKEADNANDLEDFIIEDGLKDTLKEHKVDGLMLPVSKYISSRTRDLYVRTNKYIPYEPDLTALSSKTIGDSKAYSFQDYLKTYKNYYVQYDRNWMTLQEYWAMRVREEQGSFTYAKEKNGMNRLRAIIQEVISLSLHTAIAYYESYNNDEHGNPELYSAEPNMDFTKAGSYYLENGGDDGTTILVKDNGDLDYYAGYFRPYNEKLDREQVGDELFDSQIGKTYLYDPSYELVPSYDGIIFYYPSLDEPWIQEAEKNNGYGNYVPQYFKERPFDTNGEQLFCLREDPKGEYVKTADLDGVLANFFGKMHYKLEQWRKTNSTKTKIKWSEFKIKFLSWVTGNATAVNENSTWDWVINDNWLKKKLNKLQDITQDMMDLTVEFEAMQEMENALYQDHKIDFVLVNSNGSENMAKFYQGEKTSARFKKFNSSSAINPKDGEFYSGYFFKTRGNQLISDDGTTKEIVPNKELQQAIKDIDDKNIKSDEEIEEADNFSANAGTIRKFDKRIGTLNPPGEIHYEENWDKDYTQDAISDYIFNNLSYSYSYEWVVLKIGNETIDFPGFELLTSNQQEKLINYVKKQQEGKKGILIFNPASLVIRAIKIAESGQTLISAIINSILEFLGKIIGLNEPLSKLKEILNKTDNFVNTEISLQVVTRTNDYFRIEDSVNSDISSIYKNYFSGLVFDAITDYINNKDKKPFDGKIGNTLFDNLESNSYVKSSITKKNIGGKEYIEKFLNERNRCESDRVLKDALKALGSADSDSEELTTKITTLIQSQVSHYIFYYAAVNWLLDLRNTENIKLSSLGFKVSDSNGQKILTISCKIDFKLTGCFTWTPPNTQENIAIIPFSKHIGAAFSNWRKKRYNLVPVLASKKLDDDSPNFKLFNVLKDQREQTYIYIPLDEINSTMLCAYDHSEAIEKKDSFPSTFVKQNTYTSYTPTTREQFNARYGKFWGPLFYNVVNNHQKLKASANRTFRNTKGVELTNPDISLISETITDVININESLYNSLYDNAYFEWVQDNKDDHYEAIQDNQWSVTTYEPVFHDFGKKRDGSKTLYHYDHERNYFRPYKASDNTWKFFDGHLGSTTPVYEFVPQPNGTGRWMYFSAKDWYIPIDKDRFVTPRRYKRIRDYDTGNYVYDNGEYVNIDGYMDKRLKRFTLDYSDLEVSFCDTYEFKANDFAINLDEANLSYGVLAGDYEDNKKKYLYFDCSQTEGENFGFFDTDVVTDSILDEKLKERWVYWIAEVQESFSLTENPYNPVGIVFNSKTDKNYPFIGMQLFKYYPYYADLTYQKTEENKANTNEADWADTFVEKRMVIPGEIPDTKELSYQSHYIYDPKEMNDIDKITYEYIGKDPFDNGWEYDYDEKCQKIRSINEKESNYFNLLQSLCETFECWVKFKIDHDDNTGQIQYRDVPVYIQKLRSEESDTLSEAIDDSKILLTEKLQLLSSSYPYKCIEEIPIEVKMDFVTVDSNAQDSSMIGPLTVAQYYNEWIKDKKGLYVKKGKDQFVLAEDLLDSETSSEDRYTMKKKSQKQINLEKRRKAIEFFNNEENVASLFDIKYMRVPDKRIVFKEYVGTENYAGFKYGVNLKNTKRNIDSSQFTSKIIVKPNTNRYANNKFCSIQRANDNFLKENFFYNFDYYVQQRLLDNDELNRDLYDDQNGEHLGFFSKLGYLNQDLDKLASRLADLSVSIDKTKADYETASLGRQSSTEEIQKLVNLIQGNYGTYGQLIDSPWTFNKSKQYIEKEDKGVTTLPHDQDAIYYINGVETVSTLHIPITRLSIEYPRYNDVLRSWFDEMDVYQNKYTGYHNAELKYKKLLDSLESEKTELEELQDVITKKKNELIILFYQKYSRYIHEGAWTNNTYLDDNLYFLDALSVLRNSAFPKISYQIGVVDLYPLEDYQVFDFKIGNRTYVEDTEFFGYYQGTPAKEEIIISEISFFPEDPIRNSIRVQNYHTQFEDLFKRITTQVQQLKFREGNYGIASTAAKQTIKVINYNNNYNYSNNINTDALQNYQYNTTIPADLIKGQLNLDTIIIGSSSKPGLKIDRLGITAYAKKANGDLSYSKFIRHDNYGIYGMDLGNTSLSVNNTFTGGLREIEKYANFALTWNGFMLKSGNEFNRVKIGTDTDIRMQVNGGASWKDRLIIGRLLDDSKNEYYGFRILNDNDETVLETYPNGELYLKRKLRISDFKPSLTVLDREVLIEHINEDGEIYYADPADSAADVESKVNLGIVEVFERGFDKDYNNAFFHNDKIPSDYDSSVYLTKVFSVAANSRTLEDEKIFEQFSEQQIREYEYFAPYTPEVGEVVQLYQYNTETHTYDAYVPTKSIDYDGNITKETYSIDKHTSAELNEDELTLTETREPTEQQLYIKVKRSGLLARNETFAIFDNGNLIARNAYVEGNIHALTGKIGALNILRDGTLYTDNFVKGVSGFKLSNLGILEANNVELSGIIHAEGGDIGGILITENGIESENFNKKENKGFRFTKDGDIFANTFNFSNGKVGILNIGNGGSLYTDDYSDGTDGSGYKLWINSFGKSELIAHNVFLSGKINATSGEIGGIEITSSGIKTGKIDDGKGFIISSDGTITAAGVELSGNIAAKTGSIGEIIIENGGIHQKAMKFEITKEGDATFKNAYISGTLATVVFEKRSVQSIGGSMVLKEALKATKLYYLENEGLLCFRIKQESSNDQDEQFNSTTLNAWKNKQGISINHYLVRLTGLVIDSECLEEGQIYLNCNLDNLLPATAYYNVDDGVDELVTINIDLLLEEIENIIRKTNKDFENRNITFDKEKIVELWNKNLSDIILLKILNNVNDNSNKFSTIVLNGYNENNLGYPNSISMTISELNPLKTNNPDSEVRTINTTEQSFILGELPQTVKEIIENGFITSGFEKHVETKETEETGETEEENFYEDIVFARPDLEMPDIPNNGLYAKNAYIQGTLIGSDIYGGTIYGAKIKGQEIDGGTIHGAGIEGGRIVGTEIEGSTIYAGNILSKNEDDIYEYGLISNPKNLTDTKYEKNYFIYIKNKDERIPVFSTNFNGETNISYAKINTLSVNSLTSAESEINKLIVRNIYSSMEGSQINFFSSAINFNDTISIQENGIKLQKEASFSEKVSFGGDISFYNSIHFYDKNIEDKFEETFSLEGYNLCLNNNFNLNVKENDFYRTILGLYVNEKIISINADINIGLILIKKKNNGLDIDFTEGG